MLACEPHLLISAARHAGPLPVTAIERLDDRGQPVLPAPGRRYAHLTSDSLARGPAAIREAVAGPLPAWHRAGEAPAATPATPMRPAGFSAPCSPTRPVVR